MCDSVRCRSSGQILGLQLWRSGWAAVLWPALPKKAKINRFFAIFTNIWPLARPNIAKRKPLREKKAPLILKCWFLAPQAPETSIWAPVSHCERACSDSKDFDVCFCPALPVSQIFIDFLRLGPVLEAFLSSWALTDH